MLSKITVSPAPHISQPLSTRRVMLDVIIGLALPVAAAGWYFREFAAITLAITVASCMLGEWIVNWMRKKPNSLGDLSAIVTGIILALSLPPATPWWVGVIGGLFAIMIVKMPFGGLGFNIFNPAMAARVFLTACFGALMTTWTAPATIEKEAFAADNAVTKTISPSNVQAVTQATTMGWSKMILKGEKTADQITPLVKSSVTGNEGGCLGETSALAILIGGIYMLIRKTITWRIPFAVLASAALIAVIAWLIKPAAFVNPLVHLVGGGMMLCAFFIATDPVTSPLTAKGELIFGAGVGILIMLIRLLGEYPEGVMFAVLIMNALTPLIDRFTKLIPAGGVPNVK
jgi:electron transport complex protein RnfD